jgi:hypothetical protein
MLRGVSSALNVPEFLTKRLPSPWPPGLSSAFYSVPGFIHCKKRLSIFPSPAGMSLTKLSMARNY